MLYSSDITSSIKKHLHGRWQNVWHYLASNNSTISILVYLNILIIIVSEWAVFYVPTNTV